MGTFTDDYRDQLADCEHATEDTDGFPWYVLGELTEAQALELLPLLDDLQIHAQDRQPIPEGEIFVREKPLRKLGLAARCVRIVDLATDPEACGDLPADWGGFARQLRNLDDDDVPSAPVALAALIARVCHGSRAELDDLKTYVDRAEYRWDRHRLAVERFVRAVEGLSKGLKPASAPEANLHHVVEWWRLQGPGLQSMACEAEKCLGRDLEILNVNVTRWKGSREAVTPKTGGHYHDVVYEAREFALKCGSKPWQARGGPGMLNRLFGAVGIRLSDSAIQKRRGRSAT
jgi:hypothetical protein